MMPLALLGPLGGAELIIILFIVLLLFGATRIPKLAKSLGEGVRNFRTGIRGEEEEETKSPDGTLPGKSDTK